MRRNKLLILLALLMTAATGAWATDGIACSASDIGKVLCTDGSIYATVGDATTAQKTAAAMIAYIDATNNKGLAIALADESGTKDYEAAGTACSGKAAVTGGTWRLPSDKDWQYMFIGCGSSESYSAPTRAMSKSYSGLASKLTTAQGAALQTVEYWSSTKDDPNGAWIVVFDGSNATFYMEDKTVEHKVRACLAFDVTSTYTVSLKDGVKDAANWTIASGSSSVKGNVADGLTGLSEGAEVTVSYTGRMKVKSVTATTDAVPAYAANEYNEADWDYGDKKVIFTKQTAASVTAVTNSDTDVTWGAGWYTVSGNVTINGKVTLSAHTHLILQDGATLTINGQLNASYDLYIYGQMEGTGKLNVTCNDNAIEGSRGMTTNIHGGEITATATGDSHHGLYFGKIMMYSGKLTATAADYGIGSNTYGINVYGGEVEGIANAASDTHHGIKCDGILMVYGGKVKGTGNANGQGIYGKIKSSTSNIKFYFHADGATWGDGAYYGDAVEAPAIRYAKAE